MHISIIAENIINNKILDLAIEIQPQNNSLFFSATKQNIKYDSNKIR